jgi:hypothetical protein
MAADLVELAFVRCRVWDHTLVGSWSTKHLLVGRFCRYGRLCLFPHRHQMGKILEGGLKRGILGNRQEWGRRGQDVTIMNIPSFEVLRNCSDRFSC